MHSSASIGAMAVVAAGAVINARARVHPLVYVGEGVEIGEKRLAETVAAAEAAPAATPEAA